MACRFALQSPPPSASGAIAIVRLDGDIDGGLRALGLAEVPLGRAGVRDWAGVDQVVVARFAPNLALMFPHAGAANLTRLLAALERAGLQCSTSAEARDEYPEAADQFEARMLRALSQAQSPLAIDLLLDQPRRWKEHGSGSDPAARMSDAESAVLRRLIEPPLVVALGAPNIGKSSLLNALAGRSVAIVADEPGTTRDHVGLSLDLAGLVVRYIDTPGIAPGADPIQAEAQALALRAAAGADLLLLCADAGSSYPDSPRPNSQILRVGLRSDLGGPAEGCEIAVSARTGERLEALAALIRDRLVPPALLRDNRPWTFW